MTSGLRCKSGFERQRYNKFFTPKHSALSPLFQSTYSSYDVCQTCSITWAVKSTRPTFSRFFDIRYASLLWAIKRKGPHSMSGIRVPTHHLISDIWVITRLEAVGTHPRIGFNRPVASRLTVQIIWGLASNQIKRIIYLRMRIWCAQISSSLVLPLPNLCQTYSLMLPLEPSNAVDGITWLQSSRKHYSRIATPSFTDDWLFFT